MSAVPTDRLRGDTQNLAAQETLWWDLDGVTGPYKGRWGPGALVWVQAAPCLSS